MTLICKNCRSTERSLVQLTKDGLARTQEFVRKSGGLFGVVYDNLHFTWRKASQRLDSGVQQFNITTSAIFSFPACYTLESFRSAFTKSGRDSNARNNFTLTDLQPSAEQQQHLLDAFKHHLRQFLITYTPGSLCKRKHHKHIKNQIKRHKPRIRCLEHEKTQLFTNPALNQEEASVPGTVKVITRIYTEFLKFSKSTACSMVRFICGDWLTIRNIRLIQEERPDEFDEFKRMDWLQEASMWSIYRTHAGHSKDKDPALLEAPSQASESLQARCRKTRLKQTKELLRHSLIARVLYCTRWVLCIIDAEWQFKLLWSLYRRVILGERPGSPSLEKWCPDWAEFDAVVSELAVWFLSTSAAQEAMDGMDEVLGHSKFFMRDAMMFEVFSKAVRDADIGMM